MALVQIKNIQTGEWETIDISEEQFNSFNKINEEATSTDKLKNYIDNLNISPEMKAMLDSILNLTIKVGEMIVNIGRKIIEVVIYIVQQFPNMVMGTIIGFILGTLISSIPILGWIFGPIVIPALTFIGATYGLSFDMTDKNTKNTINKYVDEMFGAFQDIKVKS